MHLFFSSVPFCHVGPWAGRSGDHPRSGVEGKIQGSVQSPGVGKLGSQEPEDLSGELSQGFRGLGRARVQEAGHGAYIKCHELDRVPPLTQQTFVC